MLRRVIRVIIQVEAPKIQSSALGLVEELLADVEISKVSEPVSGYYQPN